MTDLVVQLGARLDQFASDMNKAGDIADGAISRIEGAFAGLNPGMGGLAAFGSVLAGGVGAAAALFAGLKQVNAELAEIGKNAEYVGVTTERFQQIKFGATQGGVSSAEAVKDLKNVADLLADAQRNENSLTKVLDANGIKYRDRNGQIMNMNGLLKAAADLLGRFESIPDKTKAAQMLGLSAGWVDALKGGPAVFEAIAASANAAGLVIDERTIEKAQRFDTAWKKSSDQLSLQFKAATADVASYLDDLIGRANTFFTELERGRSGGKADKPDLGSTFDRYADAASIAIRQEMGLAQDLETVQRVLDRVNASANPDAGLVAFLKEVRAEAELVANRLRGIEMLKNQMNGLPSAEGVPLPRERPGDAPKSNPLAGTGRLPPRKTESDTRDTLDREMDRIEKQIALNKADAESVRENTGARVQLRTEASLYAAAERAGIKNTEDYAEKIHEMSERAGEAAEKLAKAEEQVRQLNAASATIGNALSTAFADAVVEGKNLNDVMSSLLKTLEKAAINSAFASVFNAPSSGGLSPFASLLSSIIPGFADGTNSAPGGLAMVGERGPELVNLPRGAQVVPSDVTKQLGGSTIAITSHVDARGSNISEGQLRAILDVRDRNLARQFAASSPGRNLRFQQLGT
ncbi:hypothetical protein ACQR1Y_12235 [Bradyrhizobium sp. HKCCYLRH3099]|uniref:hypothetical protein n=1 Tax=unclassified Bradyrhizobium TaxID=2631580 RepID=UPI003EBC3257